MRFAVALVTLLIAGALVATGILQRTVLLPPDRVAVSSQVPDDVRFVVVPGAVLRSHSGQQRVHLEGSGTAFAAYGRGADVMAWLAGERYAELGVDAEGRAVQPVVRTAPAVAGLEGGAAGDPDGSDLWLDQRSAERALDWTVNVPASVSLLIASDGEGAAPSSVEVSWPVSTGTPLAVPMIITGGALAVVGLLLYVWALVHVRRRRGPRRTPPPKMPKRPQPPRYRPARPVASGPGKGRRSTRRSTVHRWVPAVALSAAVLAAAFGTAPPQPAAAAEPVPPAVTEQQADRIVRAAADVAAKADRSRDAELLATRFAGPALELREAAYRIRAKDKKATMPPSVPLDSGVVNPTLPEATDTWPRTLFTVVTDDADEKVAPLALTMVQDDPWSDYKVHFAMALLPKATLPDLPAMTTGAHRVAAGTTVLRIPPEDLASAYGTLLRDEEADVAAVFDTADDELAEGVGEKVKRAAAKKLGTTASIAIKDLPSGADGVLALTTADAGALVSVPLQERWTVKPKRGDVAVKPSGGTKILSRTASTDTGIASVYGYQLLFSVPAAGSEEPVVLLGYDQGLVSAKEL